MSMSSAWKSVLTTVQESIGSETISESARQKRDEKTDNDLVHRLVQDAYAHVDPSIIPTCPTVHIHRECRVDRGGCADGLTNEIHVFFNTGVRLLYYEPLLRYVVYHEMGHIACQHSVNTRRLLSRAYWTMGLTASLLAAGLVSVAKNAALGLFTVFVAPPLAMHVSHGLIQRKKRQTQEPEADRWAMKHLLQAHHYDSVAVAMASRVGSSLLATEDTNTNKEAKDDDSSHPPAMEEYAAMQKCVEKAGFRVNCAQSHEAHARICVSVHRVLDDREMAKEVVRVILNKRTDSC